MIGTNGVTIQKILEDYNVQIKVLNQKPNSDTTKQRWPTSEYLRSTTEYF
jgi:hypothetical protein